MNFLVCALIGFCIVTTGFFISSINNMSWKDLGTLHKIILVIIAIINPTIWVLFVFCIIFFTLGACVELPNILKERKQKKELFNIQKEKQEKQKTESVLKYIKQCRGE